MAAAGVVDVRLIEPTVKALAGALQKAHAAANRGVTYPRSEKLDRSADFWGRFARDCMRERAGRRRSCRAGYQTPEVIAGWWTDPAGRRHFRVLGRTRGRYGRMRNEGELRGLPPWWHVYPESVLAVREPNGPEPGTYLACCRCGKVGTPESLGWMGDTCGPCFDRRADGGTPSAGFGHFSGWQTWQPCVGFSADGARLIGLRHKSNRLRTVNRFDGTEVLGKPLSGPIAATVAAGDGFVLGLANGVAFRWDGGNLTRLVPSPRLFGRAAMSPDGSRMILLSQNVGFVADLTADRPAYQRVDGAGGSHVALRFSRDGKRVYALSGLGELLAISPTTLASTVLRANVFDGIRPYGFAHDLAASPDGSALALIRETYYPASHTLRLIPLADNRPAYDLPLPNWHRPNAAAFAPDGTHLVTADPQAGWVGFWRLPSGKPVGFVRAVPEDPTWRSGQVAFSPDGRAIAVLYSGVHQERGSTVVVWPWPDVVTAAAG
jgi:hypothetical protein